MHRFQNKQKSTCVCVPSSIVRYFHVMRFQVCAEPQYQAPLSFLQSQNVNKTPPSSSIYLNISEICMYCVRVHDDDSAFNAIIIWENSMWVWDCLITQKCPIIIRLLMSGQSFYQIITFNKFDILFVPFEKRWPSGYGKWCEKFMKSQKMTSFEQMNVKHYTHKRIKSKKILKIESTKISCKWC